MTALDFSVLPPEVNSARMYAGPGAGPLMAAASAWDRLAGELGSASTSYQDVVASLTGQAWQGSAAAAMAAAAQPYAEWMSTTAAQAGQIANQARAAAAAYEAAFAATVPPAAIAANRQLLTALVATNIAGQNTPAIAANQAEYAEMWAQDAAAMHAYTGSAQAVTTVAPFHAPPQSSNPAGQSAQAAAANAAASATGNPLLDAWLQLAGTPLLSSTNGLATSFGSSALFYAAIPFFSAGVEFLQFTGMLNAATVNGTGFGAAAAAGLASASEAPVSAAGATLAGSTLAGSAGAAPASAGLGRAAAVGGLSVPQTWAQSSPAIRLAGSALPTADLAGLPATAGIHAPASGGGRPLVTGVINAPRRRGSGSRFKPRAPLSASAQGKSRNYKETPGQWQQPSRRVAEVPSALDSCERRELENLRAAVGELAKERDEASRLIRKEFRPCP